MDRNTVDVHPGDAPETPDMGHQSLPTPSAAQITPAAGSAAEGGQGSRAEIGLDGSDWEAAKPVVKAFLAQQNTFQRANGLASRFRRPAPST